MTNRGESKQPVQFTAVIPARYGSTRLPGKPLKDIGGRPMIEWVYGQAAASGAAEVIVATDDARIVTACGRFGAPVALTSPEHESGTDRIAELAERFAWPDDKIVVNVQGDEPFVPPRLIRQTAGLLARHPEAAIATLMTPVASEQEFHDPSYAKVVTDRDGWALYFSRAPIPWPRDGGVPSAQRHIGLYGYRVASLKAITSAGACALERIERLEQLRALWLGHRIIVASALELPPPHVDTEEDLLIARRFAAENYGADLP